MSNSDSNVIERSFEITKFIEVTKEQFPHYDFNFTRLTFRDPLTHHLWLGWCLAKGLL